MYCIQKDHDGSILDETKPNSIWILFDRITYPQNSQIELEYIQYSLAESIRRWWKYVWSWCLVTILASRSARILFIVVIALAWWLLYSSKGLLSSFDEGLKEPSPAWPSVIILECRLHFPRKKAKMKL